MSGGPPLGPGDLVFSSVPVAHVPLLDRLAPVRDAGFAGISVQPSDIWQLEAEGMSAGEVARRIADHGLAIAEVDGTACWLPSQRTCDATGELASAMRGLTPDRVFATAGRIGARSITVIEMFGVTPSLDEAAEAFAALCDRAAADGLLVHIEFLPFGGIPDLASGLAIVEAAGRPNGKLTVDSWHLFRSGSTLADLAGISGECIGTVQINDAPARASGDLLHETMNGRLLPGQGEFDLPGFIRTLDAIGSRAPIGVEVFSPAEREQSIDRIARAWATSARAVLDEARRT